MNHLWCSETDHADTPRSAAINRLADQVLAEPAVRLIASLTDSAVACELGVASLRRAISDFYVDVSGLALNVREELVRKGQVDWSDTTLAQHQRREARRFLSSVAGQLKAMEHPIHLIDFGAGDGQMTRAALDGLMRGGATVSGIQLIDQNIRALEAARACFETATDRSMLQITSGDFRAVIPQAPRKVATIALASAAFHELANDERFVMLKRLSKAVQGLVIVELSQDNDGADLASHHDVLRVMRFYDQLIGDAYASLERRKIRTVVGAFLLGEFIQLLSSDYPGRGNYHLSIGQWAESLDACGFRVAARYESRLGKLTTAYLLATPATS